MKVIVSKTGKIHGRGSMPHKWISGLSEKERKALKERTAVVLVPDKSAHHYTQCGFKQVTYWHGKYGHREATKDQVKSAGKKFKSTMNCKYHL